MASRDPALLSMSKLLRAFNRAFNRHDPKAMMAMMTKDCIFENTYPPPDGQWFKGREAVMSFWVDFLRASEDAHLDVEEMFFGQDRAAQRWTYSWRDPGGSVGHVRGADLFRFREGKICEKLSYVEGQDPGRHAVFALLPRAVRVLVDVCTWVRPVMRFNSGLVPP